MNFILISCALLSSLAFLVYAISYFLSPHMKSEFERFDLKDFGLFVIVLEILGAIGLLVGLLYNPILLLSSGGLSLLMLLGLMTRIRMKDGFWVSLPAIALMILNGYIFYLGMAK
jgi:hypothetical protein